MTKTLATIAIAILIIGPSVTAALRLTGHFLTRHVFAPHDKATPPARDRFVERFTRTPPISSGTIGA